MTQNIAYYRTADDDFMDLNSQDALDMLTRNFPAVVEQGRAADLSEGYQAMSTLQIAKHLQNQHGLRLVYASQQRSNKRDPRFQEHVLRFQFPQNGPVALQNVGDSVPELVLSNSHNGRSAIKFYAGIFRLVCSNGMVIADADFGRIRQRHFGANAIGNVKAVIEGSARRMALLDARIRKMQEIVLHPHDQNMLARMLMEIRKTPEWLEPGTVLEARRETDERGEDGNRSLWTTFNVLQENLSNREINGVFEDRARYMRPVHGSMRDLALNEGLWLKLEEFIEDRFPQIYAESLNRDVEEFVPAAEDQDSVPVAPAAVLRSFDELMALTFDEMVNVSVPEYEALSAEQRKKFASKKSYLKRKENA